METAKIVERLMKEERMNSVQAFTYAWIIKEQYSKSLQNAAFDWVDGKNINNTEMHGISIEQIVRSSGCTQIQALNLLYILSVNPYDGMEILEKCARRDLIERG